MRLISRYPSGCGPGMFTRVNVVLMQRRNRQDQVLCSVPEDDVRMASESRSARLTAGRGSRQLHKA